jgi:hypothetical protein
MECRTMEWNLNWRFWRCGVLAGANSKGRPSQEPQSVSEWEASLIERGVASEWASPIAGQLASAYKTLGRGSAAGLLLGATLTVEAQAGERAGMEHGIRDVREVERLLGAFSGELEKLDEVLEVLAAYAQRMRNKPHRPTGRTLH